MERTKISSASTGSSDGSKTAVQACPSRTSEMTSTDRWDRNQHDLARETFNCCLQIYEVACQNKALLSRLAQERGHRQGECFRYQLYYKSPVTTGEALQLLAASIGQAVGGDILQADHKCTVEHVQEEAQPQELPWQAIRLTTGGNEIKFKSLVLARVDELNRKHVIRTTLPCKENLYRKQVAAPVLFDTALEDLTRIVALLFAK